MQRTFLLFLLSLMTLAAQSVDYLPLAQGNQWIYRSARGSEALNLEVTGTQQAGDRTYWVLNGYSSQPLLVRADGNGNILQFDADSKSERSLLRFDGQDFIGGMPECKQTGRSNAKPVEIKSPVGVFNSAVAIDFTPGQCADAGTTQEVYLPYVGMLRRTVQSFAGPRDYELVYARLGSVTYLSEAGTSFGINISVFPAPADARDQSTRISARLTLSNKTGEDLALNFSSGQTYDFRVKNANGDGVYTWSATRLFPAVVRELRFQGEKTWSETFDISTNLPPGDYSVEGFLTNSNGPRFAATASFTVPGPRPAAQ